MGTYYETWPLLHKEYGHPMIVEAAEVWCAEHQRWEAGSIQAMVSPGAFMAAVNLNIEFAYGEHMWKLDSSTSLVDKGVCSYGNRRGRLWEVRARNASDMKLMDGEDHELAVAVLFPVENAWGLVAAHLDSLEHWEGFDKMVAEMPVELPT
jgi:hypothetical protein